jgi:hypothetical protein
MVSRCCADYRGNDSKSAGYERLPVVEEIWLWRNDSPFVCDDGAGLDVCVAPITFPRLATRRAIFAGGAGVSASVSAGAGAVTASKASRAAREVNFLTGMVSPCF